MTKTGHTYTPPKTRESEQAIRAAFQEAVGEIEPIEGPIDVYIRFYDNKFIIDITECERPVTTKMRGDLDNYIKQVSDSLNGLAWVDDKQIVSIKGFKV